MDHFKRSIDHVLPSEWRDKMAFDIALYMADKIMKLERTIIADIHSARPYQYEKYQELARANNYELISFLLYPPLGVCLERNNKRKIPDIKYEVRDEDVKEYWQTVHHIAGEKVIDTSCLDPEEVVKEILADVFRN